MDAKQIKEYLAKGYIRVNVLLELIGNPKEHIEKTLNALVKQLKENENLIWIKEEIGAPEETADKLWGAFCEAELLFVDFYTLGEFAFTYSPAVIDILGPEKITIKDKEMTDFFGEILSQIHSINSRLIEANNQNIAYQRSMNALVRNAILVGLMNDEMTSEEIGKKIGILAKDIEPVLEAMIKEKKLVKNGKKFKRI